MSDVSLYITQLLTETFEPPYAYLSTITEEDLVGRGNIVEETKTMLTLYNKCLNYWVSSVIHHSSSSVIHHSSSSSVIHHSSSSVMHHSHSSPRTSIQELLSTSQQIPNIAMNPQSDNVNLSEYAEKFILFLQREKHNIVPYNVYPRNEQERRLQDTINFLNQLTTIKDGRNCLIPQYIVNNVKTRYMARTVVRCASNP